MTKMERTLQHTMHKTAHLPTYKSAHNAGACLMEQLGFRTEYEEYCCVVPRFFVFIPFNFCKASLRQVFLLEYVVAILVVGWIAAIE